MLKCVTAHALRTDLGNVLGRLGHNNERFVIFRRNSPVGILLSIQDYVKEHPDEYYDVQDFTDTLMEQMDPDFQASLRRSARETRRGRYLTHAELKLALRNEKFR
jgi:hypothetical protein